jgi:hypothetical protein
MYSPRQPTIPHSLNKKRRLELHGNALDLKSTKNEEPGRAYITFSFIGSTKETVSSRLTVKDHHRGVIVQAMLSQVGRPLLTTCALGMRLLLRLHAHAYAHRLKFI